MNSEIRNLSSRNSILLDYTTEEGDGFMVVTYSYLFHMTVISDNPGCVGSIGKFLWNNVKLLHSKHVLPPPYLLLKKQYL